MSRRDRVPIRSPTAWRGRRHRCCSRSPAPRWPRTRASARAWREVGHPFDRRTGRGSGCARRPARWPPPARGPRDATPDGRGTPLLRDRAPGFPTDRPVTPSDRTPGRSSLPSSHGAPYLRLGLGPRTAVFLPRPRADRQDFRRHRVRRPARRCPSCETLRFLVVQWADRWRHQLPRLKTLRGRRDRRRALPRRSRCGSR